MSHEAVGFSKETLNRKMSLENVHRKKVVKMFQGFYKEVCQTLMNKDAAVLRLTIELAAVLAIIFVQPERQPNKEKKDEYKNKS